MEITIFLEILFSGLFNFFKTIKKPQDDTAPVLGCRKRFIQELCFLLFTRATTNGKKKTDSHHSKPCRLLEIYFNQLRARLLFPLQLTITIPQERLTSLQIFSQVCFTHTESIIYMEDQESEKYFTTSLQYQRRCNELRT